ncbi:cellulose binding domain-containing protein [Dactylosporangium sp. NBC_01737]|uniref:cellulose binding domain-containing protein n=1 Tax=Dactylosporangium sp. NBC_01737 TaxID=2975959 RepID=UPI002E0F490A|nr:cellulose binding domain-containing protein [Dactylosporangium sp. NBC_01737]
MSKRRYGAPVLAALAALIMVVAGHTLTSGGATAEAATNGVLATTAGCGRSPALSSGTRTIQSSGQNRTYILRVPDNYDSNRPYRLIFALHWLNGSAGNVSSAGFYGLQPLSGNSAIFVAPQGINNGWANTNGQDLTLVDDLTKLIESSLCVDTTQLFALGWSYGGAMSYAIACARPTVFRAVSVLSGANLSGCSGGTQPVAYFGIHGTHDSVLNISSGRSLRDTFVRNNGCTAQSPREPSQGSLTHITTTYSGCRSGYPVQWAAFDGDHTPSPVDGSGSPNDARTWTSGEIWKFFSQFQNTTPPSSPPPSSSPPVSPSASPSSSPPPSGQPGTCTATYRMINDWPGGFQGEFTVANNGSTTLSGWTTRFSLAGGQAISSLWNGVNTGTTGAITVRNAVYNGALGANATTTFGFTATGASTPPSGITCTSP